MSATSVTPAAVLDRIVAFLGAIDLPVRFGPLPVEGAVPGITIDHGALVVDRSEQSFTGDLLHEAGHLALLPPADRSRAHGRLDAEWGGGYELGAIGWSYAAAVHLDLPAEVVFHADGYRGESAWIVDTFASGCHLGVPLLQWAGLTWEVGHNPPGQPPYPAMRRWVRSAETTP